MHVYEHLYKCFAAILLPPMSESWISFGKEDKENERISSYASKSVNVLQQFLS